jgi:hypothetical protein
MRRPRPGGTNEDVEAGTLHLLSIDRHLAYVRYVLIQMNNLLTLVIVGSSEPSH